MTDGGGLTQGTPTTLRWSFVRDGVNIPAVSGFGSAGSSRLIAFLDGLYGAGPGGSDLTQRPWFSLFTASFDRLTAVSGLTYVYEPNDDGASFPDSPGARDVRGDVRISARPIDGAFNFLAANFFPDGGDMIIDTDDGGTFGQRANNSLEMRNVLMHEQGHGVGLNHEEPVDNTTLLEPFLNTNFDGPQFDDILGLHRHYGDAGEKPSGNDTRATATPLGTIATGATLVRGANGDITTERVEATAVDFLSIDGTSDADVFSFSLSATSVLSIKLTPVGPTYRSAPQGGTAITFNAANQSNLKLELLDSSGAALLTVDAAGLGGAEVISQFTVGAGGTFYARVSGAEDRAQMYKLDLTVEPQPFDFGDAPDTFGTRLASNGARHNGTGLTLGATRDQEGDAVPPLNGSGDDVNGLADEDGVRFGLLIPGTVGRATVNVQGGSGFLNAWIDFNGNGVFGPGEQVATNLAVGVGNQVITFAIPAGASLGTHYARFRLTSAAVAAPSPVGLLPDGEVEDYAAAFTTGTLNENFDGVTPPALPAAWASFNAGAAANAWVTSATTPFSARNSAFVPGLAGAGDTSLVSPLFTYSAANYILFFRNFYQAQAGFDGGVLELSLNGGPFVDILTAGGAFTGGGYNTSIGATAKSPLAGRPAWSGNSANYILSSVALPAAGYGQEAQLRWRFASDDATASTGWRIDDVRLLAPNVLLSGGNLVFDDQATRNNVLTATRVGANFRFQDASLALVAGLGLTQVDFNTVEVAAGPVTGRLLINTHGGDDMVTLNLAGGGLPPGGISFVGGAGNDTLSVQGLSAGTLVAPLAFDGGDGADTLQLGGSGNVAVINFVGGAGDDTLSVPGALNTASLTFDGGSGSDTATVSGGLTGGNILFNVGDGDDVVTLGPTTVTTLLNYVGGTGTDWLVLTGALTVPAGGSVVFDGGDGHDRAVLVAALVHRFRFSGLAGDDVLSLGGDLSVLTGGNFTFDAGVGNDQLELGGVVRPAPGAVFDYVGGDGVDAIASTGPAAHTWSIGVNTVTYDNLLTFAAVEKVQGGAGPDTFVFRPGSRFGGTLDAGGGRDVLHLAALGAVGVTVGTAGAADGFAVSFGGGPTRGQVLNINRVNAGGGRADTFVGLHGPAQWALDGGGASYTSQGFTLSLGGFEALRGGAGPDQLGVGPGFAPAAFNGGPGVDSVRVNGSAGHDVFAFGVSSVRLNGRVLAFSAVEALEAFGGFGNDVFDASGLAYAFSRLDLHGEAGADTFAATPAQTTWLRVFGGRDGQVDTLVIRRGTARFAGFVPPPTSRNGRFSFVGRQAIDFADIDVLKGTRSQFLPSSF